MKYILKISVFLILTGYFTTSVSAEVVDRIVAVVNRKVITLYQLQEAQKAFLREVKGSKETEQARTKVLNALIEEELIRQAAEKEGILVSQDDLNAALDDIKQRNNLLTDEQLKDALGKEGKTWEHFTEDIRNQIKAAKLVNREVYSKVDLSESDVEAYYQNHPDLFQQSPPTVRVRQILLKVDEKADEAEIQRVKAKAEQLVQQLRAGADFAEMAKQNSEDPSAQSGGEFGTFKQGDLAAPFNMVFDLKVGDISDPVQSAQGFHILSVQEKRSGEQASYEAAKPKIRQKLREEKSQELYQQWIANLKEKTYIEVNEE
jgi:peptidyl-prolyl cis-trans isomerase SurA